MNMVLLPLRASAATRSSGNTDAKLSVTVLFMIRALTRQVGTTSGSSDHRALSEMSAHSEGRYQLDDPREVCAWPENVFATTSRTVGFPVDEHTSAG